MNIRRFVSQQEEQEVSHSIAQQDRLFSLSWDNSKLRIDPRERWKKREARGTHYANGYVTLNNGNVFESMSELVHHLEKAGTFELRYDDEEGEG